ncbi:MAG: hypothetical protein R3F17_16860 [Planctomycetota bacterium]
MGPWRTTCASRAIWPEAGKLLKEAIPVARSFHARGFAVRDAEWLGRLQEEYAEWLVQCGSLTDNLRAFQAARQAYQLAEIRTARRRKLAGFEARVAQVRMLRVRGNQNAEDGHEQGHSHGE